MNKNINLCEILKGHESEIFYSRCFGDLTLLHIDDMLCFKNKYNKKFIYFRNGKFTEEGEQDLFPSKEQRNWNKWIEENNNNNKTPKTWNDINVKENSTQFFISLHPEYDSKNKKYYYFENYSKDIITKSAVALLKICELIDIGYGGIPTLQEWQTLGMDYSFYDIKLNNVTGEFEIAANEYYSLISFHKFEQAEEFLSYPENIQLLKDYYMFN